jgi:3-oxoacyl-[acyl-carrier-protein] synthase III
MTALDSVSTYLPDQRVTIEEMAARLDLSAMQVRMFKRYHGLAEVRADPDGSLLDLLYGAAAGLTGLRGREHDVRYVLYARTLPAVTPYPVNPLHDLCRRLGLAHAVAFTVTHHACASGLLAIHLAGLLLAAEASPSALALVLAGEKRFTRDAQVQAGVVFGEGAAACVVRADGERDRLLSYATSVNTALDLDLPEVAVRVEQEYPDWLAAVITTAVARAGLGLDEIDLILPHNVNVASWQRVCRRIGSPIDKVMLVNVPRAGHAFCADAFVNYCTARERGLLRRGRRYLIAAAGAARGATFSAMVLEH